MNVDMKELVWLNLLWFYVIFGVNAACPSLNISYPPTRTSLCPGDVINYMCTLNSTQSIINILWTGSGFQCSNPGFPVNTIVLTQSAGVSLNPATVSCGTNTSAVMTSISGTCYTSVLTIFTPQSFIGTTVTCKESGTTIGSDTLNVQLTTPPPTPTMISLTSPSSDQLRVNWASVSTATSYNVSINGSTPISLPANANTYTFTGLTNNSVYIVSVVAINCAGNSSPATITGRTGMGPTSSSTIILMPSTSPASKPSATSSSSVALGVGIGVGVGVPLLLALVIVIIGLVYCSSKGRDSRSKISSEKGSPDITDGSIPPSKPPRATKQASPSEEPLKPKAAPKPGEGLVYADVGIKTKQNGAKPGPTKKTIEEGVAYSDIKHH